MSKILEANKLLNIYPRLAAEWHKEKNMLQPNEVTFGSNKIVHIV